MAEPKAQLVAPVGNINLPGMNATGVITATFSGVGGVVTNLTGSPDLDVGIVTGSSFIGDGTGHAAGLTGTPELNLGITTATSFTGDATGKAAGLTGTPNLNVGLITATSFVGFVTGNVTGNLTGTVTGLGASVKSGANLGVGVCTAIQYHGNGSALTGAGSSAFIAQEVSITGDETIIDLSDGNVIYLTQTAGSTTVGFASTSPAEQITILRNPNTTGSEPWSVDFDSGGVDFDGSDYLSIPDSVDFNYSNDPFTIEFWINANADGIDSKLVAAHTSGGLYGAANFFMSSGVLQLYASSAGASSFDLSNGLVFGTLAQGVWNHVAVARESSSIRMFFNGALQNTISFAGDMFDATGTFQIAARNGTTQFNGKISNFRVVKNTAVYTEDFVPPTELANITNTKLLCCQSTSSTTASAVTPGTITANGDPTAGSENITRSGTEAVSSYSITWPNTVKWNGGTTPTLLSNPYSGAFQIFHLTTGDTGASYQAWEEMEDAPRSPMDSSTLWAWGYNDFGALGQNNTVKYSSPTQIPGTTWRQISDAKEGRSGAVLKTDGTIWAQGDNRAGQLGQNTSGDNSSPVQIPGTTWDYISAGGNNLQHYQGIKTDNTLWMWGSNEAGELGQNTDGDDRSSPVQIPGTTWRQTSSGSYNAFGIKTNGTLWAWGAGWYGDLGLNQGWPTTYKLSSPTQIPGTWGAVSAGMNASMATRTNGELWIWGYNSEGVLANNDRANQSSPIQVPGTSWSTDNLKLANGYGDAACAIKTDGTLWIWGKSQFGELGQNEGGVVRRSSPTQVGTDTTWKTVTTGERNVFATKTDGTLWSWGYNQSGQLGFNAPDNTNLSSPTQIPGTWNAVDGVGKATYALKG